AWVEIGPASGVLRRGGSARGDQRRRNGHRRARKARLPGRGNRAAEHEAIGAGLLRALACGGLEQSRALRWRALWLPRAGVWGPHRHVREDARTRFRRRGEAPHPDRHLRAFTRLLRRILHTGAATAAAEI